MFQMLSMAGSTPEHPLHSSQQIPQLGYGDGYGRYGRYGKGWYQPGHSWGPASAHGPATYGGKGQKGKGSKGKGGNIIVVNDDQNGIPDVPGHESESSAYTHSTSSGRSNAWAMRKLRRGHINPKKEDTEPVIHVVEVQADVSQAAPTSTHPISPISPDAKVVMANMESVQTLINSLKGRTDEYSMKARSQLEQDLSALRIRKTQLKPLGDQSSILEALVEKRTALLSQSEQNVQTAISEMENAKQALMVAQQQLLQVTEAKAKEDEQVLGQQAARQLLDNQQSVANQPTTVLILGMFLS